MDQSDTSHSPSSRYDFSAIEKRWQNYWEENHTFKAENNTAKPKYYVLDMFPYPSGAGLHIGHPEGYTATDILGRTRKAQGFNVLHPMGWDAFGLPAEQHAIATGTPPAINTAENIKNFKRQLKSFGFGIDWSREINTTDPQYFKWTQWIFLQLFKKGLAYVDERPVWWCPALGTVLANEEVIDGKSERGNHPVERRNLRQWVLKITAYADELLKDLETLDWPDSTKRQQIAWIGKSDGAYVHFDVEGSNEKLTVFTTRIDTLFGVTFMVIAPEHPLLDILTTPEHQEAVATYVNHVKNKSDLERTDLAKYKTGQFTGSYALHPITKERIPVWVADYVLVSYGTGAIMGVPAHDDRDQEFATQFNLPIVDVISSEETLINSEAFNNLGIQEAQRKIIDHLQKSHHAESTVQYKLRDWLFSRQRYWGEPFPIIWVDAAAFESFNASACNELKQYQPDTPIICKHEGIPYYAIALPHKALPLTLPKVETYQPSGDAESPLANASQWTNVAINLATGDIISQSDLKEESGWILGRRETNTMPQWAGSCWYYLRYMDPSNDQQLVSPEIEKYWQAPDMYIGGAEHAVLHLLYARFWHKVLFDLKVVSTPEPFKKLIHQGIILGELEYTLFTDKDHQPVSAELEDNSVHKVTKEPLLCKKITEAEIQKQGDHYVLKADSKIRIDARSFKMSKSRGNVVNPDDLIAQYGADSIRLYEMFLGPLEAMKPWSSQGIEGISRFLRKIWREYIDIEGKVTPKIKDGIQESADTLKILHETIKKVSEDIDILSFNTAISQMMTFINFIQKQEAFSLETAKTFLQLLAPFAPHIAEELWAKLGQEPSIVNASWPQAKNEYLVQNTVKVAVQVNGKLRAEIEVDKSASEDSVFSLAGSHEKVAPHLGDKNIVKKIYVPGKIVNLVVK